MVRMVLGPQQSRQYQFLDAVRPIFDALPPFVKHDVALQIELALIDLGAKIAHTVGLEPEKKRQRGRGRDVEVIGPVLSGPGVVSTSGRFHPRIKSFGRRLLGPHEHQMLEQVREAGAPGPFHPGANVVGDVDGHLGHGVVLAENQHQAVGERCLGERDVHFLRACGS